MDDVVTLSTPHQGVANPSAHDDEQWQQMRSGSAFIERLHENGRAGATHGSPQSVLAVPQRLGGGAFPGRILVTDHRDQGGKRNDGP
jgi:hypothetical protein